MEQLPNEIILHILMFLSFKDLYIVSRISREFYFLCNSRVDYKKFYDTAWSLYDDKTIFFNALNNCCLGIQGDLIKSFRMLKSKQYLVTLLEK